MGRIPAVAFSVWWILLASGGAHAQDPAAVTPLDHAFNELDRNNDGVISSEEADRSVILSSNFATADIDADNAIDRMEFGTFQSRISGGAGGTAGGLIPPPTAPQGEVGAFEAPETTESPTTGDTVTPFPPGDTGATMGPDGSLTPGGTPQPFSPGAGLATPPTTSSPGGTPPTFSAPGRTPPTSSSPGGTPSTPASPGGTPSTSSSPGGTPPTSASPGGTPSTPAGP